MGPNTDHSRTDCNQTACPDHLPERFPDHFPDHLPEHFPDHSPEHFPDHLIVVTRYPAPGQTKTRLIPALGPLGAAQVQRQMTEHTLATVERLVAQRQQQQPQRPLQVWICYTGADRDAMVAWLGDAGRYVPQGNGDLGDRMAQAFVQVFAAGAQRAVIIGIDCPDLTPEILAQAFDRLQETALVLGPAQDGGYYLLGLQRLEVSLFSPPLAWGTASVLSETLIRAEQAGLTVTQLPALRDVDDPEDLACWAQHQVSRQRLLQGQTSPKISIIMPVRNEAIALAQYLPRLLDQACCSEVIVVDGASQDRSVILAQALGARVLSLDQAHRAHQMNAGAAEARGDFLVFLHGDTQLPPDFETQVQQTLAQPGVVAGAFALQIEGEGAGLRWVEWGVAWRSRYRQLPYGDQAIFLSRAQFAVLGGFAPLPIMEDFELVQRLKRRGRLAIAPAAVVTSGRRWQKLGVLRTTLINQGMLMGYRLGIAPAVLARWYRRRA